MSERINISLIDYEGEKNETLKDILDSVNGYLLRNKGAVSDFNLVKDIVDRNIDKVDDEISNNLPTPLYLGLMGTMLGIVGGLFFMPEISVDTLNAASEVAQIAAENTNDSNGALGGIDALLNGVKIAMFASVTGLALTIAGNYFFFRARKKVEHQKHGFFTFIQTRLLPILSKNTSSSIYSLQANLLKFNRDFTTNMRAFSSTVNEVKQTFDSQLEVVQELKRIDVANIAKYNIEVMQQLQASFKKLQNLAEYLDNMNGFIGNTRELNLAINKQLEKVGELSNIIKHFDQNAEQISDSSRYLKYHFENFDQREQKINNRIADFDKNTLQAFEDLEGLTHKRKNDFNTITVDISNDYKEFFTNLKNLTERIFDDENGTLKSIKSEVHEMKGMTLGLSSVEKKLNDQDKSIKDLLEILKDKSIEVKPSKFTTIGTIVLASVGTLTCAIIIYKLLII